MTSKRDKSMLRQHYVSFSDLSIGATSRDSKSYNAKSLKRLSHQIFKAFFMTYDIKSVLSAWTLMVYKFFHLVVILIF